MVGAGSVVTRDVPPYGLVLGNPARLRGFVCPCGYRLEKTSQGKDQQDQPVVIAKCTKCGMEVEIPAEDWKKWDSDAIR
jgi:DNA-directed RNA polymerase subunit RPC12/RpoP